MNETDLLGFPKRKFGDRLVVNGQRAIVLKNMGLAALCPCADSLYVYFENDTDGVVDNADFDIW